MIDVFIQSYYYRRERVSFGQTQGYGKEFPLMNEMAAILGHATIQEWGLARAMQNQKNDDPRLYERLRPPTMAEWAREYMATWHLGIDSLQRPPRKP